MRAKGILRIKKPDETTARFHGHDYYTPEDVLPQVKDKSTLEATLAHYAQPFINIHTGEEPSLRRRYVEKVRPALRWFCKKYGVNIPEWLKGDGHYGELGPEEHKAMFGEEPLESREFEELRMEKPTTENK